MIIKKKIWPEFFELVKSRKRTLKYAGAKRIEWYITFPPVRYPCYQGIDFPTKKELLAGGIDGGDVEDVNDAVKKYLEVDKVGYIDVERLSKGIGLPRCELCLACTLGDYSCLKYPPTTLGES